MPWNKKWLLPVVAVGAALVLALAGCGKEGAPRNAERQKQSGTLNGAGATFPYPLYSKWFDEYAKQTGVKINYQSIGSGGGIKGITEKTIDFGASDAPMTDEELGKAPGILHIPTVLGSVAVVYNLPGVSDLKLDGETLAEIFLGNVKKWNDPKLQALNPGVNLPDREISVVHRSDGSGTTSVFTDYLSKASAAWKGKVGAGKSVEWPVGIGAKGNEGVGGTVAQTEGGIGYVELAYAVINKMSFAAIKNQAGRFVAPSVEGTTAAAAGAAAGMPDDLRVSITNAPGEQAYPIASYTYLLVYQEQGDQRKGKELVDFLWWAVHDGQKMASDLLYAPLPQEVVLKVEQKINSITYQGKPLR